MLIRKIILFIVILTFCCLPFVSKERYILFSNAVVKHGKIINLQVLAFAGDTTNALTANSSSSVKSASDNAIKPVRKGFFTEDREKFLTDVAREPKEKDYRHEINSYIIYMPSRKAKAMPGEVEIIKSEFEYSYNFKLFNQLPITFSLDNEYISINDTVALELPSHLVGLSAGVETTLPFFNFEKTYLNLGINPSVYGDSYSLRTSAFRIPTDVFLIYNPKEQLTLIAGVAVRPDFKDAVLPIIGCIYKPNEKLTFELTSDTSNITYSPNDKFDLFFEVSSPIGSEYEVTRNSSKGVVLQYNEMLIGTGIKYKLNKFIQSSIVMGGAFDRYIKYRDEDGKVSIKNGLYTEFRVDVEI